MSKTIKEERLRWILPIYHKQMKLVDVAKICPHSQRSLERWLAAYRQHGEAGLEPESTRPKTQPKETPIRVKKRILELRRKTKLCSLKLSWKLEKEGLIVHPRTIGKIIKQEGLTRRYRTKKTQYQYVKFPLRRGELVEIDVKYVPQKINGRRCYQFTAVDCASRWRYLQAYKGQDNYQASEFLKELIAVAPFRIRAIKTDNGAIFTNRYTGYLKSKDPWHVRLHPFDVLCGKLNIIHYLIDPGKPAQNGKVERSHRTDQEQFYDRVSFESFNDLKQKIRLWNLKYNNLEHCGLNGLSPNEYLQLSTNLHCLKPTNVCA